MTEILSNPGELRDDYSTVVIGSGYGGAITAARLAERGLPVCLLERGKEWRIGEFPDEFKELAANVRNKKHPLGLLDYYLCRDIDVLKGNGLGGTSLVNANVAIRPDPELFVDERWPSVYRDLAASGDLWRYYERAERMLRVRPHPQALELTKVQMVKKRADQLSDARFGPLNIAVSFDPEGPNHVGVHQKPCIGCNDCITGCNVGAKNTLYMNYLPYAKQKGVEIFTQTEVLHIEKGAGGYTVVYRRNHVDGFGAPRRLRARNVILSAGSLGSTEILLRSRENGLSVSDRLGTSFSGNGDYLGLAYNGDFRTNVMGFGNRLGSERSQVQPGPTIVSAIQYHRGKPFRDRMTVQDFSALPSGLVNFFRFSLPALAITGLDMDEGFRDKAEELQRIGRDVAGWNPEGAENHSMVYLVMAMDDAGGRMQLDEDGRVEINWPRLRNLEKDPLFQRIDQELREHARTLGATYVHLTRPKLFGVDNLITAHPLGGCSMGENADTGVVDADGHVYDGQGGIQEGLRVVDGAIVPSPIGVNPFLTISALAERIAERMGAVPVA